MVDITVFPYLSPRIIQVDVPQTEAAVQDLLDAIRDWEDDAANMSFEFLIDAAGKEELGAGVTVGITATLQNAQIYFPPRSTPISNTETCTTADTLGLTLTSSTSTFVTDGVVRGDVIFNSATGAMSTVLSVDSETQLTSLALTGGSRNDWQVGDGVWTYHNPQCNISGGNLVAIDDVGAEMSPVLQSSLAQVVRTSSSSATLANQKETADIKFLIETLRPHHTGLGNIWYWDPISGNDAFDGASSSTAFATFAAAHSAATDGGHDVIVALSSDPGQTIVTEQIEITKNYLFLRGPGRDFRFKPTNTTSPTISINATGVEISGVVVDTAASGGQSAIEVQDGADFFFIDHVWSRDAQHAALKVLGSTVYGRVDGCFFSHPLDDGIHVDGDTRHLKITNTEVDSPGDSGVHLEGTTVRNNIIGNGVKIYNADGYGIRIDSPGTRNHIDGDVSLYDNTLGNLLDNGTLTDNEWGRNAEMSTQVPEIHRILGLDASNPMTVTPSNRSAGTVVQLITGDGENTTTVTRQ